MSQKIWHWRVAGVGIHGEKNHSELLHHGTDALLNSIEFLK